MYQNWIKGVGLINWKDNEAFDALVDAVDGCNLPKAKFLRSSTSPWMDNADS